MAKEIEAVTEKPVAKVEVSSDALKIAALEATVNQLNSLVQSILPMLNKGQATAEQLSSHERLVKKAEERNGVVRSLFEQSEKTLQDGQYKFYVSITGEPQMQRIVGAADEANAQMKYMKYHGIRAITEPDKQIVVQKYKRGMDEELPTRIKNALQTAS